MAAASEEPNPFGSFGNHHDLDDDEAHGLAGMLTADNTINVLDSPFASTNIHDDLRAEAANNSRSTGSSSGLGQSRTGLRPSATSSVGASASAAAKAAGPPAAAPLAGTAAAGAANNSNGAVVDILESPFSVPACMSQDLKRVESEMAAAAAAEELSSSAAALNIGRNCSGGSNP